MPVLSPMKSITPSYSDKDIHVAQERGYSKNAQDWLVNNQGKNLYTPKNNQRKIIQGLRRATHLGEKALEQMGNNTFEGINHSHEAGLSIMCYSQASKPRGCNSLPPPPWRPVPRQQTYPGDCRQLDFTHMPCCKRYKYLLLYEDPFTRWIEAFPCRTEKTTEVTKTLLREIVPRFGLP